MTKQEAIEELKYDYNELGKAIPCDTGWGVAIDEAYKMAIVALEKQIPITPIKLVEYKTFSGKCLGIIGECHKCREIIHAPVLYCCHCGQKFNWNICDYDTVEIKV